MSEANDLMPLLDAVIRKVFDNDDAFMAHFFPELDGCELLEFYMASERSRVAILSWDGVTFTDTVKTHEVIDWCEGI